MNDDADAEPNDAEPNDWPEIAARASWPSPEPERVIMTCRVCGEHSAEERTRVREVVFMKHDLRIEDDVFTHCSSCQSDYYTSTQSKEADRRLVDARRRAERLMTPNLVVAEGALDGLSPSERDEVLAQITAMIFAGGGIEALLERSRRVTPIPRSGRCPFCERFLVLDADTGEDAGDKVCATEGCEAKERIVFMGDEVIARLHQRIDLDLDDEDGAE
jgi:hypothetical protein